MTDLFMPEGKLAYPFVLRRAIPADKAAVIAVSEAIDPHDYIPGDYDAMVAETGPEGLYVAELNGQVFSCHHIGFPGPGDAYLSAMRVHPKMQGHGLGSLLCRAQIEQVRALGGENVYLLSNVTNFPAHRAVQKNGFENWGEWVIYYSVVPPALRMPGRARAARMADLPRVLRFRQENEQGKLSGVIAPSSEAWAVKSLRDSDWLPAQMAVVEGERYLNGLMLYTISDHTLLIRRLEGTEAAAADLLAFAAAEGARLGATRWDISLPKWSEPLLASLTLDPEKVFRPYVFCMPAGKELG